MMILIKKKKNLNIMFNIILNKIIEDEKNFINSDVNIIDNNILKNENKIIKL